LNLTNKTQRHDFYHLLFTNLVFVVISLFFIPFLPTTAQFEWLGTTVEYSAILATISVPVIVGLGSIGVWWLIRSDTHPYVRNRRVYRNLTMMMIVAFNAIGFYTALQTVGVFLPFEQTVLITSGLLIMFVGNVWPKLKPNYVVGIRNPFTLADDIVWIKTHQFAGYLYLFIGLALLISLSLTAVVQLIIGLVSVLLLIIAPFIYSLRKYRQRQKNRIVEQHVED